MIKILFYPILLINALAIGCAPTRYNYSPPTVIRDVTPIKSYVTYWYDQKDSTYQNPIDTLIVDLANFDAGPLAYFLKSRDYVSFELLYLDGTQCTKPIVDTLDKGIYTFIPRLAGGAFLWRRAIGKEKTTRRIKIPN